MKKSLFTELDYRKALKFLYTETIDNLENCYNRSINYSFFEEPEIKIDIYDYPWGECVDILNNQINLIDDKYKHENGKDQCEIKALYDTSDVSDDEGSYNGGSDNEGRVEDEREDEEEEEEMYSILEEWEMHLLTWRRRLELLTKRFKDGTLRIPKSLENKDGKIVLCSTRCGVDMEIIYHIQVYIPSQFLNKIEIGQWASCIYKPVDVNVGDGFDLEPIMDIEPDFSSYLCSEIHIPDNSTIDSYGWIVGMSRIIE